MQLVKRTAAIVLGAVAILTVMAAPAAAQKMEAGGAFSCVDWNSGFCDGQGFAVDFGLVVHKAPTTALSIIGDLGWSRVASFEDDLSIVGGVRERFMRTARISPYAQVTTGAMRWKPTSAFDAPGTDFMIGGGGGVQVRLNDMFDAKAEFNFWRSVNDGDWDTITRFTAGGVFKFGGK
jgi:hypothetical protein